MQFRETRFEGAYLIEPTPLEDERGFFARTFCQREFEAAGLETRFVQHSISHSIAARTLRGMHFQRAPHEEVKIVSCLQGRLFDVIVDLRPASATCRQWESFELTAENRRQLYIPKGFAHGFMTLEDDSVAAYLISEFHAPAAASGLRYDDPAIGIEWPAPPSVVSRRDLDWALLQSERA